MPPSLDDVDHVHVMVADRRGALDWYQRVLGVEPVADLAAWAVDGGPLTLGNATGSVHLALFERPVQPGNRSTVALRVSAQDFVAWREHLRVALAAEPEFQDHELAVSLYFADPDGNPYEITTYEVDALADRR